MIRLLCSHQNATNARVIRSIHFLEFENHEIQEGFDLFFRIVFMVRGSTSENEQYCP